MVYYHLLCVTYMVKCHASLLQYSVLLFTDRQLVVTYCAD